MIDGEGNVRMERYRASKNRKWYLRASVRIANTNRPCLEKIRDWIGVGFVTTEHPRTATRKVCFRYQLQNKNAAILLSKILPLLTVKVDVARKVIAHYGLTVPER